MMNTGFPVRPVPYPSSRAWLPVSDTSFPSFVSLFLWTRLLSLPQSIVRHTHGLRQSCTAGYPTPHYPRDDVPSAPISRHSLLNSSCKNSPVLMVPRCSCPPLYSLSGATVRVSVSGSCLSSSSARVSSVSGLLGLELVGGHGEEAEQGRLVGRVAAVARHGLGVLALSHHTQIDNKDESQHTQSMAERRPSKRPLGRPHCTLST